MPHMWDYLILTASNDRQAAGYVSQLDLRRRAGMLPEVGTTMVVADPLGKRVGSGGSTLFCLMQVVAAEMERTGRRAGDWAEIESLLREPRILILHAGGDSRRVPAYGPCGKIFSPVPGEPRGEVISTLFDRLYPVFRDMPRGPNGAGQVIVAAGDALLLFDSGVVDFNRAGMIALGAYATPDAASKHGVFCVAEDGRTRLFLQKPSPEEQQRLGAIDTQGRSVLDIGVMSFDAGTALALFRAFDVQPSRGGPHFSHSMQALVLEHGLDLYREICCALGTEATAVHHQISARASGSKWTAAQLAKAYGALSSVPFSTEILSHCDFLHFGTTRQLITSGMELLHHDSAGTLGKLGLAETEKQFLADVKSQYESEQVCGLSLNNHLTKNGHIVGGSSWVEGCRIGSTLRVNGENVVVGADIDDALELPRGACLDVIEGQTRAGRNAWFVRIYHINDTFKDTLGFGGTLAGHPLGKWFAAVGATVDDLWPSDIPYQDRSLWNARVFPAVPSPKDYRDWLWMLDPSTATGEQKQAFLTADRYSVAEIALLADMDAFYSRRNPKCVTP